MVHADTREITAFAYVWIHRSSERASASGRPGFIGLLQARRGMAARERKRDEKREAARQQEMRRRQRRTEASGKGSARGRVGGIGRWWLRGRTHRRGFTVSEV